MAKTTLSKLGLKPNTEIKTITWNDQTIEVKQYLPIKDKIELISNICNASTDDNHYINYVRVNIYAQVYTYLAYTNITITDKQKEDIFKLYDMFAGGLGDELQVTIPHAELDFINSNGITHEMPILGAIINNVQVNLRHKLTEDCEVKFMKIRVV